ncbi:MAG TPA: hypothetical protein DEF16_08310 [Gemmobacter sp.]|nr:hypothetical protein [Gemmobacter sp.]
MIFVRVVSGMVLQGMEGFDQGTARRHPGDVDARPDSFSVASAAITGQVDIRGRTLLHHAAQLGDSHTCRSLLAAGADPRRLDHDGRAAADLARSAGHFELAAALEGRVETEDVIAARAPLTPRELIGLVRDEAKTVQDLIARKRLNARDAKGDTPLHIAAMRGKIHIAELFVSAGADIHATNAAGRTPSEAATANGFALLAALLGSAAGSENVEPPPTASNKTSPRSVDGSRVGIAKTPTSIATNLSATAVDLEQLDDLAFEGSIDAGDFHDHLELDETRASFQRISGDIRVHSGFAEAQIDWDLGPVRGTIEGDGIAKNKLPERTAEQQHSLVGRHGLRRAAQPSLWRRFGIDMAGCRAIVERVFEAGHLSDDDFDDILGICDGQFDPVDLLVNLRREFEAAGFYRIEEQTDALWDAASPVDVEDLTEAIITSCTRTMDLPGTGRHVPVQKELLRLTATLVDARRATLLGLVESPEALDIILYMADRIVEREVAPDIVTTLVFDPAHPAREGQQFMEAIRTLRERRDDIAGGSSRGIRAAADAAELLELRPEFLRDVATAMRESAELAGVANRLDRNLDALEAGFGEILDAFIPLCRRYAAQNAGEGEDQEDLFQVGFFGLRRAVIRFQPELGTHFTAYASAWLRQSIGRWRADESRLIRLPVHRQAILNECRQAAEMIETRTLRDATKEEIAAELRRAPELMTMLAHLPLDAVELDQLDHLAAEGMDDNIPDYVRLADLVMLVHEELRQLQPRPADIIRRRFGIGFADEMTLEEIGQLYGVTRERIRQIEAKGLVVLRHPARIRYLSKAL